MTQVQGVLSPFDGGPRRVLGRAGATRPLAQAIRAVLDYSRPPFAKWFVGGQTNLCYNAVDRHLPARGEQKALVYISTETGEQRSFTFRELHAEVNRFAAAMRSLGRRKRRSRHHLHADDRRGLFCDARLCSYRRDPLGRVRRLRVSQPGHPHR